VTRLGALQIDSVNVFVRSHYLPAFARLGPYRRDMLDDLAYRRRALFEYWGHRASLLPVELFPLFRWKMRLLSDPTVDARALGRYGVWAAENASFVELVYREVEEGGPLAASELSDPGQRSGPWWGWARGKLALEWLFREGRVTVASRRNFERLYDLTERVIPKEILAAPAVAEDVAHRELILIAARALGVATVADIADYFFMSSSVVRGIVGALVDEGALVRTGVEGWRDTAYLVSGMKLPRRVDARALVSPFDSLIWNRKRAQRVFSLDYRIEIYTPVEQRTYGYLVLPFLLGDGFAGRLDLKADRAAGALLVQAAHFEPGAEREGVAEGMAACLDEAAGWLGLDSVRVVARGDAAPALRRTLRRR
jgi:uncharacterized protein YcaQ